MRGATAPTRKYSRVEEVELPRPKESAPLPRPEGCNEWDALQSAVSAASEGFSTPNAKLAWKRWALTEANAALLVAVFWWVCATVYKPDHVYSSVIQEVVFRSVAAHYVAVVLAKSGVSRDLYQATWVGTLAQATANLMRECFPRSAHKFDADFVAMVATQVRLWITGALPADNHPSCRAAEDDRQPAALHNLASGREEETPNMFRPPQQSPSLRLGLDPGAAGAGQRSATPDSNPSRVGSSSATAAHSPHVLFRFSKTSPVLSHVLAAHQLSPKAISAGLRKETCCDVLAKYHRPLDEGPDQELSYSALASDCLVQAEAAVHQYNRFKLASKQENRVIRDSLREQCRELDATRTTLCSQGKAVKKASNKLSGWLERDVDHAKTLDAQGGARMAPMRETRLVEMKLAKTLSAKRWNSVDMEAKVRWGQLQREEALNNERGVLPNDYTRGTAAIRIARAARAAMGGMYVDEYYWI